LSGTGSIFGVDRRSRHGGFRKKARNTSRGSRIQIRVAIRHGPMHNAAGYKANGGSTFAYHPISPGPRF
jgi:hypothetical protein